MTASTDICIHKELFDSSTDEYRRAGKKYREIEREILLESEFDHLVQCERKAYAIGRFRRRLCAQKTRRGTDGRKLNGNGKYKLHAQVMASDLVLKS